jgi:hypothetical protein
MSACADAQNVALKIFPLDLLQHALGILRLESAGHEGASNRHSEQVARIKLPKHGALSPNGTPRE